MRGEDHRLLGAFRRLIRVNPSAWRGSSVAWRFPAGARCPGRSGRACRLGAFCVNAEDPSHGVPVASALVWIYRRVGRACRLGARLLIPMKGGARSSEVDPLETCARACLSPRGSSRSPGQRAPDCSPGPPPCLMAAARGGGQASVQPCLVSGGRRGAAPPRGGFTARRVADSLPAAWRI